MAIKPKAFPKKGGVIGVVAPSSAINPEYLAQAVQEITKRYGASFKLGKTVSHVIEGELTAASIKRRADDLNEMFADPKIDAIMTARGGYGAQQILPYLDYELIKKNPKPISGFSDVTALLNAITVKTGMITFLGPTAEVLDPGAEYETTNLDFFFNMIQEKHDRTPLVLDHAPVVLRILEIAGMRKASGILYGGNLMLVTRLIGTEYQIPGSNSVLALEEISESAITVDGMVHHLQAAQVLRDSTPVIIGDFVRNQPSGDSHSISQEDGSPSINRTLIHRLSGQKAPVIFGMPFSHGKWNITLPLGAKVEIDPENHLVTVIESVVQ
jgi:muramoyltetrapeptide carboxypeptidase